jgi:hypothetical protein
VLRGSTGAGFALIGGDNAMSFFTINLGGFINYNYPNSG